MPLRPATAAPVPLTTDRALTLLRLSVVVALAAGALYYAVLSWHWPLMLDAPIMHYVNFMMDHGLKPYRDITDNNMPGSYLTERWAMELFGRGDLGWRIYEFFLLGLLSLAAVVIARRYDWVAGIYAGGLFLLLHGAEGPSYAVEREQVMTVLILLGYAALFEAVRCRLAWLMLPFGFLVSLAGSIKPTVAPLVLLLLALAAVALRRRQLRALPYLIWGFAGFLIAAALIALFILRFHAVGNFLFLLRTITPSYVSLWRPGVVNLLQRSWPTSFLPLVPLGLLALFANRHNWNWEKSALLGGFLFGLFSYFAQGKGFLHHRYTYLFLFLLLVAMEFTSVLRIPAWPRLVGAAGLALAVVLYVPYDILKLHAVVPNSDLTLQLERDLNTLGGPSVLNDKVQCFDLVFGCLNALYHDGILQNSGFTGDLLLFPDRQSQASRYYQAMFQREAQRDPAEIFVMTNERFGQPTSFDKINAWPDFARYLAQNYTEVLDRAFPYEGFRTPAPPDSSDFRAYRIYIRNGSPLLTRARTLLNR